MIKKLEITGFKSFGNSRKMIFDSGITAIVGPNGSGKSNIADAIRWVLGEQKIKRLRVSKSDDVIFFGTPKKPRASLAEVVLLLDNSTRKFEIDSSEVEILRKQYRSGDVEYRVNGKRTKLSKINEYLAKAGFGTETYTVIGQGMVDSLLTSSSSERKLLFEEASGIRQFELKRHTAMNNLKKAEQNLAQIENVLLELEPTTKVLQAYTKSKQKVASLKEELVIKKKVYLNNEMIRLNLESNDFAKRIEESKSKLKKVNEIITSIHTENKNNLKDQDTSRATNQLRSLEQEKDSLTKEILSKQNELEVLKSNDENQSRDIKKIEKNLETITQKRTHFQKIFLHESEKVNELQNSIDECDKEIIKINKELKLVQAKLNTNQKKEFVSHALGLVQNVRIQLRQERSRKIIDKTLQSLLQMLELAMQDDSLELVSQTGKIQRQVTYFMSKRDDLLELQTKHTIKLRSIELDISALDLEHQELLDSKLEQQKRFDESIKLKKEIQIKEKELTKLIEKNKQIASTIVKLRDEIYNSTIKKQNNDLMAQAEEQASLKTELEMNLNYLIEQNNQNKDNIDRLKSLAKDWFGNQYVFFKEKNAGTVELDEITKISAEIDAAVDVDPKEIEVAQQSQERIEFLRKQQTDLELAIDDSQKLIQSLQKDINNKFEKSFNRLNVVFNDYFKRLFGGGEAKLVLSQEDDEYGVDIAVSPPNKRGKTLSALSGGERSMASIALLSAIIHTNPSPFIVLDEVDAALDDENSTRFSNILQELSKKSQILVITHNQETMQSANNLIGITTNSLGDSEILQLNLQNAIQLSNAKS